MLTMMRNMLRSKFSGLLFLLIIISMAVWGTTDIFAPSTGGNIIKAGDRALTVRDIDRTLEFFLSRQRNEGGTVLTREQAVEQGVIDQLFAVEASRTANLGYASQIGAVATDAAVLADIQKTPAFQSEITGAFDLDTYRLALRRADLTPTLYEQDVKDAMTLSYISGAANGALQPPSILGRIRAIQLAETRTVSWFTVDADTVGPIEPPSDADLAAYYEANQAVFGVPELRTVDVISLSADDFVHQVAVPDEDLQTFYEATKAQRFSTPEQRSFTEVVASNEADARILFGKMAGGASLSESTDPELVSLSERTALRSDLVIEALAEGLFAPTSREGSVVGPVEQDGLWIVARLNAVIPGDPFPFEDVRSTIAGELAVTEAEGLYFNATAEIQSLIGAGLSLREMAEQLGVPVIRRLPIAENGRTREGGPYLGLTDAPELVEEIFGTPEGFVTNPVEYGENVTLIAEVQAIAEAYTPPLEEIREQVEARYRAETMNTAVQALADDLRERVVSGAVDFEAAADGVGRDLVVPDQAISRANFDVGLPPSSLQAVFSASEDNVITAAGPLPGQVTLVRVNTITAPTDEEIEFLSGAELPRLTSALQNDMLAALDSQVRDAVGFEANTAALEAYKTSIATPQ
ncbi:MAG: SurA N-terminal domain-containing protein [Pseudomonadota bacterium]